MSICIEVPYYVLVMSKLCVQVNEETLSYVLYFLFWQDVDTARRELSGPPLGLKMQCPLF